jgi:hypothetical protein
MAPKTAKSSAPTRFALAGRVKEPPRITQEGSAIVVTKRLAEGAQLEERYPRRRAVGKQAAGTQLILAHTVLATIGQATAAAVETKRANVQAQVDAISVMANRFLDQGRRDLEAAQANTRRAKEKLAAARTKSLAAETNCGAAPPKQRPPATTTQQGSGAASSSTARPSQASGQKPQDAEASASRPVRIPRPRLKPGGYFQ